MPFSIDLPDHVLSFSLPPKVTQSMGPRRISSRLDPFNQSLRRDGFDVLASILHDFNGPFWKGAYASFKFTVLVIKRKETPLGAETLEELEQHLRSRLSVDSTGVLHHFDQIEINGNRWVRRWSGDFGNFSPGPPDYRLRETISQPLGNGLYLDIHFEFVEYIQGHVQKWQREARAIRDSVHASIALTSKGS